MWKLRHRQLLCLHIFACSPLPEPTKCCSQRHMQEPFAWILLSWQTQDKKGRRGKKWGMSALADHSSQQGKCCHLVFFSRKALKLFILWPGLYSHTLALLWDPAGGDVLVTHNFQSTTHTPTSPFPSASGGLSAPENVHSEHTQQKGVQ